MKNRNYGWQYLTLQNKNIFIKEDFNQSLDQFWNQVMHKMNDERIVGVLLKVKFNITSFEKAIFFKNE
jgi:hypothetical protein